LYGRVLKREIARRNGKSQGEWTAKKEGKWDRNISKRKEKKNMMGRYSKQESSTKKRGNPNKENRER
jgi:hypothetical protein